MLTPVDTKIIKKFRGLYKPGYRYLQKAYLVEKGAKAIFRIKRTEYKKGVGHLTDLEAQVCLNQLCYVFFYDYFSNNTPEGVIPLRVGTIKQFTKLYQEEFFVLESHKRFRRETVPGEEFVGEIKLTGVEKLSELVYVARLSFNLNKGACRGFLKLALHLK